MNTREEKLLQQVASLADDIIDFTIRLAAEPSTLGNEASVLAMMEAELHRMGFSPQRVGLESQALAEHPGFVPVPWSLKDRYNLAAVRPADGDGGLSVLFNGHLDVVSPAPLDRWDRDPFNPMEKDGWLYGRGTGDMKAGVAAMVYAIKAVEAAGFGLAAPATIEAVIEEESSGNGTIACLAEGFDAEAVLIPEPFGPTILTSQVGVCWFKVSLSGESVHVLSAHSGVNAIEKCFLLIRALRELEKDINAEPHPAFSQNVHPANLNVGIIKGGDWPSTVPAEAEFHCRLGFLPGMTFSEIRSKVADAVARSAATDPWLAENPPVVAFYSFRSEGHHLPPDMPAFEFLQGCQKDLTGRPAAIHECTCTTDLRAFVHFGRGQATCFGPVAENIHGVNERVNIDSVIHTAKVYALFLSRWCKLID
jgi:acetylornithine deacetylase